MNIDILQKCIVELQQENPRLDYIRGMLETLVAISGPRPIPPGQVLPATGLHPIFNAADAGIPARGIPQFVKDSVVTS